MLSEEQYRIFSAVVEDARWFHRDALIFNGEPIGPHTSVLREEEDQLNTYDARCKFCGDINAADTALAEASWRLKETHA